MIKLLKEIEEKIQSRKMVLGFDGFVDHIVRPGNNIYGKEKMNIRKMSELATFLTNQQNMSCSIELNELQVKIGGNNPIMSHALGEIGIKVDSIGAYGANGIDPIFNKLSNNCNIHSIADVGRCFAIEFDTNKLMLYTNKAAQVMNYNYLIEHISSERLLEIYNNADGIAHLNFSEYQSVIDIWEGLLDNILPRLEKPKIFFFDLSDCSRVEEKCLKKALKVIKRFEEYGTVYLCLNDNELLHVFNVALGVSNLTVKLEKILRAKHIEPGELKIMLKLLYDKLGLDTLIIRTLYKFFAYDCNGFHCVNNIFVEEPKLLTGAGDNQNAGICLGLICGLEIKESLILGAMLGNFYIEKGYSPSFKELKNFTEN